MKKTNPIEQLLSEKRYMIIDGALASELQRRGCDLNDALWSANVLIENPDLITQVHYDYFSAGADCAITASYQATPLGFMQKGITKAQSLELIKRSVVLANLAKQRYLEEHGAPRSLLIAGSVGPYGAYLADGSEYTGNYALSESEFIEFHHDRIQALIDAGADLLAIETQPSFDEIKALVKLTKHFDPITCWVSLTLKDDNHLSDGMPLEQVVTYLDNSEQVVSIGVNCIALEKVTNALVALRKFTNKPLIVYPNSGATYDPITKEWHSQQHHDHTLADCAQTWLALGAQLIGGCCQTTPKDIAKMVQRLAK